MPSMKYYIRAASKKKLQEYMDRVAGCVRHTARASGVSVDVTEFENRVEGLGTNHTLSDVFKENYEKLTTLRLKNQKHTRYIRYW